MNEHKAERRKPSRVPSRAEFGAAYARIQAAWPKREQRARRLEGMMAFIPGSCMRRTDWSCGVPARLEASA